MTQTETSQRWSDSLERFLRSLSSNKAAMSDLRTGRNKTPEECRRLHRWVASFVSDGQVDTGRERSVYTVAALFATYPDLKQSDRGLGATLAALSGSPRFSESGIEARLVRLCRSATSEELCRNLWPVVSLIAAAGTSMSWASLASDINRWDFRPDQVSRRWLRDFFTDRHTEPSLNASSEPNTNEPDMTDKDS